MRNISDNSFRETQNTHFMFKMPPPPENRAVYEIVKKNRRAVQATDDNMAHSHCMLDT